MVYCDKVWVILLLSWGRYRSELTNLLTRKNITSASAEVESLQRWNGRAFLCNITGFFTAIQLNIEVFREFFCAY